LTRAFVAPAGFNARDLFRKGRANPLELRNLLNRRENPGDTSACRVIKRCTTIICHAACLVYGHLPESDSFLGEAPRKVLVIYPMLDLTGLKEGMTGQADLIVGEEHTAPRIGSGRVRVLATPVMINLMEAAALDAVERLLPPGHQSLGTHLNVGHYAATPVGMRLRATAVVTKLEGRTVEFRVEAFDEKERVGDGTHTRVVVNVERFDQRVQRKLAP
jgi:fluoroacetyl-CoA thioesterase